MAESRVYQITGWDSPSAPWVHLSGTVQDAPVAPVMVVSSQGTTISSDGPATNFGDVKEANNIDRLFTIQNTGNADLELATPPMPDLENPNMPLVPAPAVTNT